MFGMEEQKQQTDTENFDLENELQDSKKAQEKWDHIGEQMSKIKNILREGCDEPQEMDKMGTLLHGYIALQSMLTNYQSKAKQES
ncbi:MAG: DUF5398 family protein [Chlamydiota bacterium]